LEHISFAHFDTQNSICQMVYSMRPRTEVRELNREGEPKTTHRIPQRKRRFTSVSVRPETRCDIVRQTTHRI